MDAKAGESVRSPPSDTRAAAAAVERFGSFVDVPNVAVWEISLDGRLLQLNKAGEDLVGLTMGDLSTLRLSDLIDDVDRQRVGREFLDLVRTGAATSFHFRFGSQAAGREVVATAAVVRDASGRPISVVGTTIDVADVVKASADHATSGRELDGERSRLVELGRLRIDLDARRVSVDDLDIEMTRREFDLLAFLAVRPGHVFTRDELLQAVWQSESAWQQPTTVTEHVYRLRSKLQDVVGDQELIATVRGAGYRLDCPPEEESEEQVGSPEPIGRRGWMTIIGNDVVAVDAVGVDLLGADSASALVGREIFGLLADPALVRDTRAELLARGETAGAQVVRIGARGSEREVLMTPEPFDVDGTQGHLLEMQELLNRRDPTHDLVRDLFADSSDAVIVTDVRFHILSWNAAAERLYGWREDQVVGMSMRNVLRWAGDLEERDSARATLLGEGRWTGCARQIGRDGSVVAVYATVTLARDAAGQPVGVVAVNRPLDADVAGIATSQRVAVEQSPAVVLDDSGRIVDVNDAWAAFARHNGGRTAATGRGVSYLTVCERAAAAGCWDAGLVLNGLRGVLSGRQEGFRHTYNCDSPAQRRTFVVHAAAIVGSEPMMVGVDHVDVTRRSLDD